MANVHPFFILPDLDRILSEPSALPSEIDEALRAYLQLAAFHQGLCLDSYFPDVTKI